ncbi:amidohydrolase family protein [Sphingomonas sp. NCPPB 2930]
MSFKVNISRRTLLEAATLTALAPTTAISMTNAQAPAAAMPHSDVSLGHIRPPKLPLPSGSCDCHVHIFDPARFPYVAGRTYTPGTATVADLRDFTSRLGTERVVLVQPSGYGTDNRCLLDALAQLGPNRARGVAVVNPTTVPAGELAQLHAAGVRSIRLNLEVKGVESADHAKSALRNALDLVADLHWSVQIYADLTVVAGLAGIIATAKTPVVLDHFAGLKAERGVGQEGFSTLIDLLKGDSIYIKLSAPYRASKQPGYGDLAPFAKAFLETAPDRLVWASDWPHTGSSGARSEDLSRVEPFRQFDDGATLDLLRQWAGDDSLTFKILVANPARLYSFQT